MTRRQLTTSKAIVGVLSVVAVPFITWGAKKYDASKLDTVVFTAQVSHDSAQHAYDSLKSSVEYRQLRDAQERSDSTIRKICAVVVGSGC